MVEEVLVKEALSAEMIAAGAALADYLNHSTLITDAILWFYQPELNTWRYFIATPAVKKSGPQAVYRQIRTLLAQMPNAQQSVSFSDIFVVDSADPLIQLLRHVKINGQVVNGIRFSKNVIGGVFIEDAYLYKLT